MLSKQRKPRTAPIGRFVRGWRFDRNPLRRGTDRAETILLLLLAVVFLAGTLPVTLGSAAWGHAIAQRDQAAQLASRYQVAAVTLAPPEQSRGSGNLAQEARARWTAPDGTVVTGELPVRTGTKPGTSVSIWTTRDGHLTMQPMDQSSVTSITILGGLLGALAFAALLALSAALARRTLNERRMAAWDADWQATGPRWTSRR